MIGGAPSPQQGAPSLRQEGFWRWDCRWRRWLWSPYYMGHSAPQQDSTIAGSPSNAPQQQDTITPIVNRQVDSNRSNNTESSPTSVDFGVSRRKRVTEAPSEYYQARKTYKKHLATRKGKKLEEKMASFVHHEATRDLKGTTPKSRSMLFAVSGGCFAAGALPWIYLG